MSGNEQHLESDDDGKTLGMGFYCYLGSQLIAVTLVVTILSVPISMMSDQPTELAMQTVHEEDEAWREQDVHPDFALDDRTFTIEPAAGPSHLD